jgi:hypothetical protein
VEAWKVFWGNSREGVKDVVRVLLDKIGVCTSPGVLVNTLHSVAGLIEAYAAGGNAESAAETVLDRLLVVDDDGLFSNSDVERTRLMVVGYVMKWVYGTDVKIIGACVELFRKSMTETEYDACGVN